jgi:thymidylate synthase (FAD)
VVNAARVSFDKFHDTFEEGKDDKLINYLAKHGHWTPFAHAFLSFRIKAPIFVARQLVKHQVGLAWNEVSRRYVDDEPEFWLPSSDGWRGKPVNAKQGSTGIMPDPDIECATTPQLAMRYAITAYNDLIDGGYAPEQARMVLPQNMMTEWIWSGSLAAFARVCKLRMDPHAQAETAEVAMQIFENVPQQFEHSWQALVAG